VEGIVDITVPDHRVLNEFRKKTPIGTKRSFKCELVLVRP